MTLPPRWERFLTRVVSTPHIDYVEARLALTRVLAEHDAERAGTNDIWKSVESNAAATEAWPDWKKCSAGLAVPNDSTAANAQAKGDRPACVGTSEGPVNDVAAAEGTEPPPPREKLTDEASPGTLNVGGGAGGQAPPWFRVVGRSGPGNREQPFGQWVRFARRYDGTLSNDPPRQNDQRWQLWADWDAGQYDLLEPLPAEQPAPRGCVKCRNGIDRQGRACRYCSWKTEQPATPKGYCARCKEDVVIVGHKCPPWRGVCACNAGDPVFHSHYREEPHKCARCSQCSSFRPETVTAQAAPAPIMACLKCNWHPCRCDQAASDGGRLSEHRESVTCIGCSGLNGNHEVFCSTVAAHLLRGLNGISRYAIHKACAPIVRQVAALETSLRATREDAVRLTQVATESYVADCVSLRESIRVAQERADMLATDLARTQAQLGVVEREREDARRDAKEWMDEATEKRGQVVDLKRALHDAEAAAAKAVADDRAKIEELDVDVAELRNMLHHWLDLSEPPSEEAEAETKDLLDRINTRPYFDKVFKEADDRVAAERVRCYAWHRAAPLGHGPDEIDEAIRGGRPAP